MAAPGLNPDMSRRSEQIVMPPFPSASALVWTIRCSLLKGVGPQAATALEKLNLRTVGDLLRHMPRRWEDRTAFSARRRCAERRICHGLRHRHRRHHEVSEAANWRSPKSCSTMTARR